MAGIQDSSSFPNVNILKQSAKEILKLQLESMSGIKDLVLDVCLMKPLDRIAGAQFLKEHGVNKIFKLEPSLHQHDCDQRLYIVRPSVQSMKYIADHINADVSTGANKRYKLLFVPRKLYICERVLEEEGVYGHLDIDELMLDLIPLDKDILSLELPDFFRQFYLHGDQTQAHTIAQSLVHIQQLFGLIPRMYGVGRCAKMVKDLMDTMFEVHGEPKMLRNEIGHVFLIDRDIDCVTPLCSQVTYEGLLDEIFGIKCGLVEFGHEVTGKDQSIKLLLTSDDKVYEEIRNRHFSNVFGYLSATAKELQSGYDKRHLLTSVSDMKDFVAKDLKDLKQRHKSLTLHISACETIMKSKTKGDFEDILRTEHGLVEGVGSRQNMRFVEEFIDRQGSYKQALRLLCLMSLTQGGMNAADFKRLKTHFLQSHGFEYMLTFHNLKRLGLFCEIEPNVTNQKLGQLPGRLGEVANIAKTSPFRSLAKKLALIPKSADDINLRNPNDMSYVFSGAYSPLICKLIEKVLSNGSFVGMEDVMKGIPHPHFNHIRATSVKGGASNTGRRAGGGATPEMTSSRVVLVYFLGGCTYSEITALRFLGRLRGYQFLIATTSITTGNMLIDLVSEKV